MDLKQLVIDAKVAPGTGTVNQWTAIGNANTFIDSINTPDLSKKSGVNIGTLVSGIPTAFARVDLFRLALDHAATQADAQTGNLNVFFDQLVDEWKGMLACLALDYSKISVRTITLAYGDGKDTASTRNPYEMAGAFGNMLLERAPRWRDQKANANSRPAPRIDVVKYGSGAEAVIVGATAPECLLFTSTGYAITAGEPRPWLDPATRKFTDPLGGDMTDVETASLHAYAGHLLKALDKADDYYAGLPQDLQPGYGGARRVLADWQARIADYARARGYDLEAGSIPPVNAAFSAPFDAVFNYTDLLYGVEGQITETPAPGALAFDPKTLLLDAGARPARLHLGAEYARDPGLLRRLPVCVLSARKKGYRDEWAFFALPLSALGLNVYGKSIAALTGIAQQGTRVASQLDAEFDPEAADDNLEVTLTITTETGRKRRYTRRYTAGSNDGLRNTDILLWPNFVSEHWNQYYLYSELPHNGNLQTYAAFPFVGDPADEFFRIMTDEDGRPMLLARDGEAAADPARVDARLLVRSTTASASSAYQYEIYRSDKPYKGVRLLSPTGKEGGYLMVNYTTDRNLPELPQNKVGAPFNPRRVSLGVDFGSTNTSVAYSDGRQEYGFDFTNQRVSLMGKEPKDGRPQPPRENQVFFFQGGQKPVPSNALRSVLTTHDRTRLAPPAQGETEASRLQRPVVGGFPSFGENLPVRDVGEKAITLSYPKIGLVEQIHNMKWDDPDMDKVHKKAYLGTLLLQVYAQLFEQEKLPESLKWSYPSSMGNKLLHNYQAIWDAMADVSPVVVDGAPAPLKVSKATYQYNPEGDNLFDDAFPDPGDGGVFDGGSVFGDPEPDEDPWGDDKKAKAQPRADLRPDDTGRVVRYDPLPLVDASKNDSMTEATAVANFNAPTYAVQSDTITLCFDIGGSTTDISATYLLAPGLTMIKQNSLRFAAQRVCDAVAQLPDFQRVLAQACNQFGIPMLGVNVGQECYSPDTAAYFFNQIVDRLADDELSKFYGMVASECPKLMCVNMYVTGLLMYYAGEIARKLADDLAHAAPGEKEDQKGQENRRPKVRVTFAGKGSRLMQWLPTIDPAMAGSYYRGMLFEGFGGKEAIKAALGGWPEILMPANGGKDIKYEVSKGLARSVTPLFRPKDDSVAEIIGEGGYTLVAADGSRAVAPFTNSITPEMVRQIGVQFIQADNGDSCRKFMKFCDLYHKACKKIFGIDMPLEPFSQAFKEMNMARYVQNLPEYREANDEAARGNSDFDFVAPIIIMEGMKFYDDGLFRALE